VSNDRHVTDVGLAVHQAAELVVVSTIPFAADKEKFYGLGALMRTSLDG
jgi:hypothetical protein